MVLCCRPSGPPSAEDLEARQRAADAARPLSSHNSLKLLDDSHAVQMRTAICLSRQGVDSWVLGTQSRKLCECRHVW